MDTPGADATPARAFRAGDFLRDQLRNIAPFITLLCLVVFFSVAAPSFASLGNLQNILQQVSVTAIIAVGLTFVILTAEIDLSVGAVANATAIVLTFFTLQPDYVNIANLPLMGPIAIVLALAACCALGLITAFGVTRIGIPSFIMTLAMMQIGAGLSAVLVRGQIAYSVPSLILTLGSKSIAGVPWIVIVAAIFLVVAHLVLTYTRFGRYVYMVGGNREAAEYSGVNVRLIVGAVMVISAMCSGVAGMIGVAYFGSAQQNEFDTCSTRLQRWWSAARACSADAAASAIRSLASSCWAFSTCRRRFSRDRNGPYRRISTYGVPAESKIVDHFASGEGLLGQAAVDGRSFQVRDVPEGYLAIGSAFGEGKPRHLVIAPANVDGSTNAVLEFGFIHPLKAEALSLMEQMSDAIGIAVRSNYGAELQNLLEETQRQAEELQAQGEELGIDEELEEQGQR